MLVISQDEDDESRLVLRVDGDALVVRLGAGLPEGLGRPSRSEEDGRRVRYRWGRLAELEVEESPEGRCYDVAWTTGHLNVLRDLFVIDGQTLWFGGPEERTQHFPLRRDLRRKETAILPGDFLQDGGEMLLGGVADPWWVNSRGVGIWVPPGVPAYYGWNHPKEGSMSLAAKPGWPYSADGSGALSLRYKVCLGRNARETQEHAIRNFLGFPGGFPEEDLLRRPIWSTWAEYKAGVDQQAVMEFADRIVKNGLPYSQLEIDDRWEARYGDLDFDRGKFPDPAGLVRRLKEMGFKVSLWVHPFVNADSRAWEEAVSCGYLVRDAERSDLPGVTTWWQGRLAGCVDMTNPAASEWWLGRLERLRRDFGVDAFKFDAGEPNWLPTSRRLHEESVLRELWPAAYSTALAERAAGGGGGDGRRAEVRVGWRTQQLPVLVRMLDKESGWGHDNGLRSLVSTALTFSVLGYPFALPDMVGGNGYDNEDPSNASTRPSRELFIRWAQAAALMPAVQFSFAPWSYDPEVVAHVRRMMALREEHSEAILAAARRPGGEPVLKPVWWHSPEDAEALRVGDEFLVGVPGEGQLLVAPVLEKGAAARDVYLPEGTWSDLSSLPSPSREKSVRGPVWLKSYEADLWTLPLFSRRTRSEVGKK